MVEIKISTQLVDGSTITWDKRQIINVETLSQLNSNPSEINYGVLPSSGTIQILDIDKRIQTLIETEALSTTNLNIQIWVNGKQIRNQKANSIDYNVNENVLTIGLTDYLSDWNDINVPAKPLTNPISAMDMLNYIMVYSNYTDTEAMCGNLVQVRDKIVTIKEYLSDIIIQYPYLEEGKLSEQVNKICQLAQLQLIVDIDGKPVFVSARPRAFNKYMFGDSELLQENQPIILIPQSKQYSHLNKNIVKNNKYGAVNVQYNSLIENLDNLIYQSVSINIAKDGEKVEDEQAQELYNLYVDYSPSSTNPSAKIYLEYSIPLRETQYLWNIDNLEPIKVTLSANLRRYNSDSEDFTSSNSQRTLEKTDYDKLQPANTSITIYSNNFGYKIEDNLLKVKISFFSRWIEDFTFDILTTTYNTESNSLLYDDNIRSGGETFELPGNELIQQSTQYNGISLPYLLSETIISDYYKGIITGDITVSIANYYDTNGNIIKNLDNGDIIKDGDFVKIEGDDTLWKVTGSKPRKKGCPFVDLELMQALDYPQTEYTVVGVDMSLIDGSTFSAMIYAKDKEGSVNIVWGDGNSQEYSYSGYDYTLVSHTYSDPNFKGEIIIGENFDGFRDSLDYNSYKTVVKYVILSSTIDTIRYGEFNKFDNLSLFNISYPLAIGEQGLTSIDAYAFSDCKSLIEIEMPNSVTEIGANVFSNCKSLQKIQLPSKLTSISEYLFRYCESLKSISIPSLVQSIGTGAFEHCSSLVSVVIPKNVTTLGQYAFDYCSSLRDVITNANLKNLEQNTFSHCTNLAEINIPDGIEIIGFQAFAFCGSLTKIIIPNGVKEVQSSAFSNCMGLTQLTIGDNVEIIGEGAFAGCTGLTKIIYNAKSANDFISNEFNSAGIEKSGIEVIIGNNVTKIPANMFSSNTYRPKITKLTIGENVTAIGDYAFNNCQELKQINYNAVSINDLSIGINNPFQYIGQATEGIKVAFGDNVKSIPANLFNLGSILFANITAIEIGKNIETIGSNAFHNCTHLKQINFNSVNESLMLDIFKSNDIFSEIGEATDGLDIIFGENVRNIPENLFYPYNTNNAPIKSVQIGRNVETIGDLAFRECNELETLTIANGVKNIGVQAFYGCINLHGTLEIPDSVTTIGNSAFLACMKIDSLKLGKNTTTIDYYAFYGCSSLSKITIKATTPPNLLGSSAIPDDIKTIYIPKGTLNAYRTATNWSVFADKFVEI